MSNSRMISLECPSCKILYARAFKSVNEVIKKSGYWQCKNCTVTKRNISKAKPFGSTRINSKGYVLQKTENGWIQQHIFVMQNHIGRTLNKDEVVHHINEDKTDNNINNLQLMTHVEHTKLHHIGKKRTQETIDKIKDAIKKRSKA